MGGKLYPQISYTVQKRRSYTVGSAAHIVLSPIEELRLQMVIHWRQGGKSDGPTAKNINTRSA